ncbi:MAG: hypothetical protein OEU94_11305 [Aquincola sp.]|nr:hypothetical protein [Aquincola sp.]
MRSTTDPGNRAAADKVIQAQREGMGWAAPVMPKDAKSRSDYQAGYEDGLNDTNRVEYRNNRPYGDGQRAGRAKRDALRSAPNGSDRLLGYRDGYNGRRSRDGDRRNRAYEDAYRAGQSDRAALSGVRPIQPPLASPGTATRPPDSVEGMIGRGVATLDSDMQALGYTRVSQFKAGQDLMTTWSSPGQSRCVRLIARDGKVRQTMTMDFDRCM